MPLLEGSSDKVIQRNIEELMSSYKRDGKIGNVRPRSEEHARRIATAIAYARAGRSRKKKKSIGTEEQDILNAQGGADLLRRARRLVRK